MIFLLTFFSKLHNVSFMFARRETESFRNCFKSCACSHKTKNLVAPPYAAGHWRAFPPRRAGIAHSRRVGRGYRVVHDHLKPPLKTEWLRARQLCHLRFQQTRRKRARRPAIGAFSKITPFWWIAGTRRCACRCPHGVGAGSTAPGWRQGTVRSGRGFPCC